MAGSGEGVTTVLKMASEATGLPPAPGLPRTLAGLSMHGACPAPIGAHRKVHCREREGRTSTSLDPQEQWVKPASFNTNIVLSFKYMFPRQSQGQALGSKSAKETWDKMEWMGRWPSSAWAGLPAGRGGGSSFLWSSYC